jgi:TonB family protein
MMFFSDSQDIVSRFGDSIEEFRRVFRANDVDFGTPDDFFAFSRTLKHDTQLRGGLSALAKSVMAKENEVSLRTILTIIAVASGGPDVANSGRDMSRPVNLLIDFLIEAGGCSQINSEYPDSPCSDAAAAYAAGHALTPPLDDKVRAEQADVVRHISAEPDSNAPAVQFTQDRFSGTHTLTESLTRLELNSLQVKLYLDSIDQRISRMEPRLENVPSLALSNTTPRPRDDDAKFSASIPSTNEPRPPQNDPHPPTPSASDTSTAPVSSLPLWANSRKPLSPNRHAALSAAFAFAALLLCVLFFWSFARDTTHAEVHPANITGYETTNANPPGSGSPITSFPAATTSTLQPSNVVPEDSHSGGVGNPPSRNAAATPFNPPKPRPYPVPATDAPRQALAAVTSEAPDDPDAATAAMRPDKSGSVSQSDRLLNVSSGVMAANLLAAPMPAYPKLASLTRMQGNVIMQAIISKDGTVESVHVLKGHRLLRSAATTAVRAWRYQPYLVNGRPVEVATIVSVDFTLPH